MKKIPLTKGFEAIVDDEDYEMLMQYSWHVHDLRPKHELIYAQAWIRTGKTKYKTYMHRLLLKAKKGTKVDHINHNGLDNRRDNIRLCSAQQNSMNRKNRKRKLYKGVRRRWTKKSGEETYEARIMKNQQETIIGYYKTAEDAAKAYDKKAIEIFGEFAYTNFRRSHD